MGLLTALGPLAIDMYLPAFPAIVQGLNTTQGQVERTLASYLFGLAIAQIFYGPFADRYGRKLPLVMGLALFIIASIACGLTSSIEHLTLWRIVQAFGGASGMVIPRAVIRDNFDTREAAKALSVLILVMGVTPILAPLLGGQVLIFGSWRGLFAIMTICGVLLLVGVIRYMRETLPPEKAIPLRVSTIARNYTGLLRHRGFMCYTLAGGFGSAGMFAYISGSPRVFIEIFHVDPKYFGFLFGLNAAALIITSQISARLLNRYSPETLLKIAQICLAGITLAALMVTLAGAMTLPLLMLCLIGFMGSQGFVSPNAAALALSEQGNRLGVASALMGTLQMLCGALSGLAVSEWQSSTPLPLTGMLALCACLSWLFGRVALRTA
ncbi:Bcr/CflA family multidrug efflux MFS transporter [Paralcaligenes sp. KSB-10]|nr:Bcr/CflA family multidrug efflux MFS transporter [Paralcaligenes sp. KSB-10]